MKIEIELKDITNILLILILLVSAMLMGIFVSTIGYKELQWIFSASSQSIAALVAFLLTGYIFFMEELRNRDLQDASLKGIVHHIKMDSFRSIRRIFVFAFFAIFFSLYSLVYTVPQRTLEESFIHGLAIILILFTLLLVSRFTIRLIDPRKIPKAAKNMLKKMNKLELDESEDKDKLSIFLKSFVELEKYLTEPYNRKYKKHLSPRQATELLAEEGKIEKELYRKLRSVIMFRNLVVHSGVEEISHQEINLLNETLNELKDKL